MIMMMGMAAKAAVRPVGFDGARAWRVSAQGMLDTYEARRRRDETRRGPVAPHA